MLVRTAFSGCGFGATGSFLTSAGGSLLNFAYPDKRALNDDISIRVI